jgi:hypothetical protein
MGGRNYLIEGVSSAGKTAVATELQRRGYQAIHGDRGLLYRGDPETGLPIAPETDTPTAIWMFRAPDLGCRETKSLRHQPG